MRRKQITSNMPIKNEFGTEAQDQDQNQNSGHLSESSEFEKTFQLGKYAKSDRSGLVANTVKSEPVEFHLSSGDSSDYIIQKDVKTVMFEKIPKAETKLLGNNSSFCSNDEVADDLQNNKIHINSDSEAGAVPERDPFADISCDPSFSEIHQNQNNSYDYPTKVLPRANMLKETFKCPEPNCGKIYKLEKCFKAHRTFVHPPTLPSFITCSQPNCSARFQIQEDFQEHLENHERPYKCTELDCCAVFAWPSHLNFHKKLKHKIPAAKKQISDYRQIQKPQTPEPEPNCMKTLQANCELRKQISASTSYSAERPFKCPHPCCGQGFKRREHLAKHLPTHQKTTTDRVPRFKQIVMDIDLKCKKCERTFMNNWILTKHLQSHDRKDEQDKIEIFQCPQPNCSRKFKLKSYMKAHFKSHKYLNICKEPNCSRKFRCPSQLNYHFKVKHANTTTTKLMNDR